MSAKPEPWIAEALRPRAERRAQALLDAAARGEQVIGASWQEVERAAAHARRQDMIISGVMPHIERSAEAAFRARLAETAPEIASEYVRLKDEATPQARAEQLPRLSLPLDDVAFKRDFIQSRLSVALVDDADLFLRAATDLLVRREARRIDRLSRGIPVSRLRSAIEVSEAIKLLSTALLFEDTLDKMLLEATGSCDLQILVYHCLRFTHPGGRAGAYAGLDDHVAADSDGKRWCFRGEATRHQLDTAQHLATVAGRLTGVQVIVVLADFDVHKYLLPDEQHRLGLAVTAYRRAVTEMYPDLSLVSETEFFDGDPAFPAMQERIRESLRRDTGMFMAPKEFASIREAYHETFAAVLTRWDAARNDHYTVESVSRNIAEGIALGERAGNSVVAMFNDRLVNAHRMNLASGRRLPALGLPKRRSKSPVDA